MRKYQKNIIISFILASAFFPVFVFGIEIPNPIEHESLEDLIHAIVSFIRNVALALAPIIFIFAGLKYYFAGGSPEKAKEATNLIKWALIGLVIILIANGITAVIRDVMGTTD